VINRQHFRLRRIHGLPVRARLFNVPTCKPSSQSSRFWERRSRSGRDVPTSLAPNSFALNSFADPHPLTPLESHRFKKGGRGVRCSLSPPPPRIPLSPLRINTYGKPVSVDSKPLTESLSPVDATLTKNRGGGVNFPTEIPPSSSRFAPPDLS
jgi:hypothetical protein